MGRASAIRVGDDSEKSPGGFHNAGVAPSPLCADLVGPSSSARASVLLSELCSEQGCLGDVGPARAESRVGQKVFLARVPS